MKMSDVSNLCHFKLWRLNISFILSILSILLWNDRYILLQATVLSFDHDLGGSGVRLRLYVTGSTVRQTSARRVNGHVKCLKGRGRERHQKFDGSMKDFIYLWSIIKLNVENILCSMLCMTSYSGQLISSTVVRLFERDVIKAQKNILSLRIPFVFLNKSIL